MANRHRKGAPAPEPPEIVTRELVQADGTPVDWPALFAQVEKREQVIGDGRNRVVSRRRK